MIEKPCMFQYLFNLRKSGMASVFDRVKDFVSRLAQALAIVGMTLGSQHIHAQATAVTYYHNDAAGSPMLATNAAGNVVWKENYRPYGDKLNNQAASSENSIGFTGKPYDANTGFVYMGARYYDPVLGRFAGIDPEGFREEDLHSSNRYAYANNNPYKYVDPDGRLPFLLIPLALKIADIALTAYDVRSAYNSDGIKGAGAELAMAGGLSFIPGGKVVGKLADKVGDAAKGASGFDVARKAAFEKAGMTDPSKVQFSKVDPKTGTVVEFKGEGGAKVGYDGPHKSPGPHHDTQHISWQSAGKRESGGAQRGNEPYSGSRHPSRPDRKDQ